MIRKFLLATILAGAWVFVGSTNVTADPFAMSSILTNSCCTDWTDKDGGAPNPGGGLFQAGRELDQPATVNRTVQQTLATPPFALALPQSIVSTTLMFTLVDHPAASLKRLEQSNSIMNSAATLAAGGGPGEFTFCPPDIGPATGACANPGSAASPYHGLIRVSDAGINQFGGAMGFLGFAKGFIQQCAGPSGAANCDTGEATVFTRNNFSVPISVIGNGTTSLGIMAHGTNTLTDFLYSTPNWLTVPTPALTSSVISAIPATGHAWTTGMVTASISQFGAPPFQAVTLTGTDNRITTGPDAGKGTLTLVGSTLYQNPRTGVTTVRGTSLFMNLPEPAAGLAVAAGALGLVLLGLSRKRR